MTREAKLSEEISRIFKENFDRLDNIFSVQNNQLEIVIIIPNYVDWMHNPKKDFGEAVLASQISEL